MAMVTASRMADAGSRRIWREPRQGVVAGSIVLVLLLHAALLADSAARHSPTLNEPAHLAAGVALWQLRRFDLFPVDPPLTRMVAGAAAIAAGCQTNWSRYLDHL